MKNWNGIIYGLLGGVGYGVNSELLPTWSHILVGIFTALTVVAVYWPLSKNLKAWIRVSISVAVSIAVAALVRIFCV